ncbi:MAG: proton-conducting transporter transmembrane domain-containing protein, partial [Acidimicrobiales bacterium]
AHDGDEGHTIGDYRGLARQHPVLAFVFALLLLAQAGVPFTTGFLAKFGVVGAVVATHGYALAVIAMVTAAVAAFFYLRVVVTMYSPVGPSGDSTGATAWSPTSDAPETAPADPTGGATAVGHLARDRGHDDTGPSASMTENEGPAALQVLSDAPPSESVTGRAVSVPPLTWVALGLCTAFTVVFGIVPGPVLDFAHQATLLFT